MLHPERHRSQPRVRGQSQWLVVLCKTLSFSFPSRFIPALSLTPFTTPLELNDSLSVEILRKSPDINLVIPYDDNLEFNKLAFGASRDGAYRKCEPFGR